MLAQSCAPDHILPGQQLCGEDVKAVKVYVDGQEEEVQMDGLRGPLWVQSAGWPRHGELGTGRVRMPWAPKSNECTKAWCELSASEHEIHLIITAKRQRRMRESSGL